MKTSERKALYERIHSVINDKECEPLALTDECAEASAEDFIKAMQEKYKQQMED